jgi:hypothetical protein
MDSIKKTFGIIFAILFISTAVPALIFFNFDRKAFDAETYQKAFVNDDFYSKLPAGMAEAIPALTVGANQLPAVARGMSQQAWEIFFRALLPPETLKAMGDDAIHSAFAYLNLQMNSIQLSLAPLKAGLISDAGTQAVYAFLNTQPDCTLEQMAQMSLNLLNKSSIQFCKPPDKLQSILTPIIQGQMQAAALAIPGQLTLISAPLQNDPREKLQIARMAMRFSPIFPLGFLLLMTISTVNSLKSWLNWWGVPLLATGFLASLISLGGAPIFGAALQGLLSSRLPAFLPAAMPEFANNLASAMLQTLLAPVLWQGLGLAIIGLIMAVSGYFISTKK